MQLGKQTDGCPIRKENYLLVSNKCQHKQDFEQSYIHCTSSAVCLSEPSFPSVVSRVLPVNEENIQEKCSLNRCPFWKRQSGDNGTNPCKWHYNLIHNVIYQWCKMNLRLQANSSLIASSVFSRLLLLHKNLPTPILYTSVMERDWGGAWQNMGQEAWVRETGKTRAGSRGLRAWD